MEPDTTVALRVFRKQIDLLYSNQAFAVVATALVVFLTFGFLSYSLSWSSLEGWVYIFSLVLLIRLYFGKLFFSHKKNHSIDYKKFEYIYYAGIVLTGLLWASMGLWLFPILDFEGQLLFIIACLGTTGVAHTTMGYRKLPTYSFTILVLAPLIAAVNFSYFPNAFAISIAFTIYLIYILRSATVFYNYTYDTLRLQEVAIDRENELLLQREKANAANMTKSQFLSRMSHELRTPLNVISGLTELQLLDKHTPLTDKQRSRAVKVGDAGKHLLLIVNDVLDLSRIETGEMDIVLEVTSLYEIIHDSISMVEELAVARNITFSGDTVHNEVYVLADRTRLKQIIVNLLDNAVKYNKKGGRVTIAVESVENDRIRLSIIDTGYGVNSDAIDELFKPFSRLSAAELGIDGVGIGLSLCKQLIELMNGNIGAECRKGEGCCFWISIPAAKNQDLIVPSDEIVDVEAIQFKITDGKKILLVEDNLVNCEVAVDMLNSMGLDVEIAHNGLQAVEIFNIEKHILIFMDCEMPQMDGFTATQQIRLHEQETKHVAVPIIALTAHAISGAREKCIASGMNDFLSKPFSILDLNRILIKWLATRQSPDLVPQRNVSIVQPEVTLDDITCDWSVLDYDVISGYYQRQKKNHSNLLYNMISIYIEQTSNLMNDLGDALSRSDIEQIRKLSHTLKSSSENMGAFKLADMCRSVERGCEHNEMNAAEVAQVIQYYSTVEDTLNTLINSISKTN